MNYDDDMMLREYSRNKPSRFWPLFFMGFGLLAGVLLLAHKTGNLPHYTLMIDGNKWEWVRDDAKYLASLPPKPLDEVDLHNQQIIAANRAAFAKRSEQANQQGQPVIGEAQQVAEINNAPQPFYPAPRTGQITKCQTNSGRVVYQEQDCFTTGLKPVKVLSSAELTDSRADAQNTQILHQVTENNYQPAVASLNPDEKRNSQHCRDIESQRDNIRSQQRINSRQWHRDEYTRLSKLWQSDCLG